jgi:hypothetical protein
LFYRINLFKGYELLKNFYISSHNFSKFIILTMSNYSQKSSNAEVDPNGSSIDSRIKIENSDFSEFYSDEDCYEEPIDEMFLQWEEEEDKKEEDMIWKAITERTARLHPDLGESSQMNNRVENSFMPPPSPSMAQRPAVITNKPEIIMNGKSISLADWVKILKAQLYVEALSETLRLYPEMAKSWQSMAPEIVQEMVRMATGLTYNCN